MSPLGHRACDWSSLAQLPSGLTGESLSLSHAGSEPKGRFQVLHCRVGPARAASQLESPVRVRRQASGPVGRSWHHAPWDSGYRRGPARTDRTVAGLRVGPAARLGGSKREFRFKLQLPVLQTSEVPQPPFIPPLRYAPLLPCCGRMPWQRMTSRR